MFVKRGLLRIVKPWNNVEPVIPQTRRFTQVGIVVSTPPRVPCSLGEKLLHAAFMVTVWTTPLAYFLTQVKVWRRQYVES